MQTENLARQRCRFGILSLQNDLTDQFKDSEIDVSNSLQSHIDILAIDLRPRNLALQKLYS